MFTWTDRYPELGKIKEAYYMLRSQGIAHEPQKNVIAPSKKSTDSTLKLMESEKFKRLLQSKNQKDIEAANLMIQNMVRDNDRRIQIQNRRLMDLQSANENSILLKEMLDEFDPNEASEDTLSTLQEIYKNCVKLKPTVCRLAEEGHESETFMNKILETTDVINKTIELYTAIIINKTPIAKKIQPSTIAKISPNLLDVTDTTNTTNSSATQQQSNNNGTFNDELNDIFSTTATTARTNSQVDSILLSPQVVFSAQQPTSSTTTTTTSIDIMALINNHKPSKQQSDDLFGNFDPKSPSKSVATSEKKSKVPLSELDSIISGMKSKLLTSAEGEIVKSAKDSDDEVNVMLINETPQEEIKPLEFVEEKLHAPIEEKKVALKDINLDIGEIQPSEIEVPRTILDEKKGLKVIVNFTKDRPAKDVVVLVISVINQGSAAINNFQFDASVTKPCKIRILEASGRVLPGLKPFKAPTETINQVLLLLNPTQEPINMIAILTYNVQDDDDDEEKVSIEVKDIPFSS